MGKASRSIVPLILALMWSVLVAVSPAEPSHQPFGVFEDWFAREIRADRVFGLNDNALEVKREIREHFLVDPLEMRIRAQGATNSDTGTTGNVRNRLALRNAAAIDQIQAAFTVAELTTRGCAANPGLTRADVGVLFFAFNDSSSTGPGDRTGDHAIIVLARHLDTTPNPGALIVQAFLQRCNDPACNTLTVIAANTEVGVVSVPGPIRLRAIFDPPNNQFRVGHDTAPDVVLPYAGDLNARPPVLPFADVRQQIMAANCTAGPTEADMTVLVGDVLTNTGAIIP
jgi:hypothetical protein